MTNEELSPDGTVLGFVGLGVMGMPMALNLIKAGYELRVYDRNPETLDALPADSTVICSSAAEVARGASATVTMLPHSSAVHSAVMGGRGIAEGGGPGHVVVDMSSISPSVARELAASLSDLGIDFLDAPVSGGQAGAKAGTLSIMVGGDAQVVAKVSPFLRVLGERFTHIGESGSGQVAKACNQVALAVTIHGVAEALTLANACGVDVARVRNAMLGGAAASAVLERKGRKMVERDFVSGFRVALQHKDLRLALEEAENHGVVLPTASLVTQSLVSLLAHGHGDQDNSALLLHIELLSAVHGDHEK